MEMHMCFRTYILQNVRRQITHKVSKNKTNTFLQPFWPSYVIKLVIRLLQSPEQRQYTGRIHLFRPDENHIVMPMVRICLPHMADISFLLV